MTIKYQDGLCSMELLTYLIISLYLNMDEHSACTQHKING